MAEVRVTEMENSEDGDEVEAAGKDYAGYYCLTCHGYPSRQCLKRHNVIVEDASYSDIDRSTDEQLFFPVISHAGSRDSTSQDLEAESTFERGVRGKIRARHIGNIGVRVDRDASVCSITGSAVMDDERLAIVDYANSRLKLVDTRSCDVTAVLELESKPWDVVEVCPGHLAVTLIDQQKIVFVQTGELLERGREIKVGGFCAGIATFREDKFVVSYICPGKVEIIDMQGRILRMFSFNLKGREFFSGPQNVAVCPFTHTIYVADCLQHKVTHLRSDGKVLHVYIDEELKSPENIVIPKQGVVFVCGFKSKNVHVLSETCEKVQILPLDIRGRPWSMSYCEETGRLYVTLSSKHHIAVYELS